MCCGKRWNRRNEGSSVEKTDVDMAYLSPWKRGIHPSLIIPYILLIVSQVTIYLKFIHKVYSTVIDMDIFYSIKIKATVLFEITSSYHSL